MNEKTILKTISKPGRYIGGEFGEMRKDKSTVRTRIAFCFPDAYEIGMSNLGMRILCGALNASPDVWCERCFTPWTDMQAHLRESNLPLCALESGDPLSVFDMVAFTLQYELCYTNVLTMLELGGIPLLARDRGENDPIILGGGPCAYNAEPVADFFDIFSIGEGEEALPELAALYTRMHADGSYTRHAFLVAAAQIPGFYVPALYEISYAADGTISAITPTEGAPATVKKRIIADMNTAYFPDRVVMPYIETVHDRIMAEVFRGCIRGCRFCQAGMVYRPVREKSASVINEQANCLFCHTGYDEISLSSLSISDYTELPTLTENLLSWTDGAMVSLSLPSMRADAFSRELAKRVSSVRSSGLTFAPEAGTARLRNVINKNLTEEEIFSACDIAFAGGKTNVKLYFMNGLPTETDEDLCGIAALAKGVVDRYYQNPNRRKGKSPQVTISVACFIPKPFTPFQWEGQAPLAALKEKQQYLLRQITDRKVRYNYHNAEISHLEAVFARGNRKLSAVLLEAHKRGLCFDAWDECFDFAAWNEAFAAAGVDPAFFANRTYEETEILPWDMIDCGVTKAFLLRERHKAYAAEPTENCREGCAGCGANTLGGVRSWCPGSPECLRDKAAATFTPTPEAETTDTPEAPPAARDDMPLRLFFTKTGRMQFISHLDLCRTMRSALRRAGNHVTYSKGYNPHIEMVFPLPLSIGIESDAACMDIRVPKTVNTTELLAALNAELPPEIRFFRAAPPKYKIGDIGFADYRITCEEPRDPRALAKALTRPLPVEKKSKRKEAHTVDIGPMLRNISVGTTPAGETYLSVRLPADSAGYLNPTYLTTALGLVDFRILRTGVFTTRDEVFE